MANVTPAAPLGPCPFTPGETVRALAATRGLGSRTVLELARLLCQLDEEMG